MTGRPTKYKPEYVEQAKKLCKLGATDCELADFFGVSDRTIYRWASLHDDFCQSLKAGKTVADERVVRSLYKKAVGFEQQEVKIFMPANAEKPIYAEYTAKYAPDTTAAIFWLKNRRPEEWRDASSMEHTGKGGGPIKVQDMTDEQLAAIAAAGSTGASKKKASAKQPG